MTAVPLTGQVQWSPPMGLSLGINHGSLGYKELSECQTVVKGGDVQWGDAFPVTGVNGQPVSGRSYQLSLERQTFGAVAERMTQFLRGGG